MIKCYYISVANLIWAISSVGQSSRLITGRSGVRVPDGPPNLRGIAQLVEQRSPKPRAEGSSPSAPAKKKKHRFSRCFFFFDCVNRLNSRHTERVEGCGSPVETSKHRRCLEAPTEPAGETKSFCHFQFVQPFAKNSTNSTRTASFEHQYYCFIRV